MSGAGHKMDVYCATSASTAEASFACPQESGTGFNLNIQLTLDAIFLVSIFLVSMLPALSVPGAAVAGILPLLAAWKYMERKVL